ncbi:MAG: epoxyqueuosine reductase [Candidatus Poribacteria bacterium]|nr:epoxyqueuosine reductase [Candidatus Poribacteria bacterium]
MSGLLIKKLTEVSINCETDLFGIAKASDFSDYAGKQSPFFYIDNAKSVIVIGKHVSDPILDVWVGRYSLINEILGNVASNILSVLIEEGKNAVLSPYGGIYCKDAAVLAGLGTIGKNNLLLTKYFGPRIRLRAIVTNAELKKSFHQQESLCNNCNGYCWSACPVNAFANGRYNKEVCDTYCDTNVKRLGDNGVLYCRECELACPIGK